MFYAKAKPLRDLFLRETQTKLRNSVVGVLSKPLSTLRDFIID